MTQSRDSSEHQRLVDNNARPQQLDTFSHEAPLQARTPLIWQGCWWFATIIPYAFIIGTVRAYEQDGNITAVQKHTFNTIITGLILALGLNFFVSHLFHALVETIKDSWVRAITGSVQILCQSISREDTRDATSQ